MMPDLGAPMAQFGPLLQHRPLTERHIRRVLRQIWIQLAPELPKIVRKPDLCSIWWSDMGPGHILSNFLKKELILARQLEARFNAAKSCLASRQVVLQGSAA